MLQTKTKIPIKWKLEGVSFVVEDMRIVNVVKVNSPSSKLFKDKAINDKRVPKNDIFRTYPIEIIREYLGIGLAIIRVKETKNETMFAWNGRSILHVRGMWKKERA